MAALQNAIDLRFAVADRIGNRDISDVFDTLLELAETDLNSRLRTRMQITSSTITFVDGSAPMPVDCIEPIDVSGISTARYGIGASSIVIPGTMGDRTLTYYARLPSLTASPTATNWMLASYPSVYLYAVALEAAKHLRDTNAAVVMASLLGDALKLLVVDDQRMRWSMAAVRVKGLTP